MDAQEEIVIVSKGKRTKRPRQPSPTPLTLAMASSSCSTDGERVNNNSNSIDDHGGFANSSPTTTSVELTDQSTDQEEEDMANCLILLAKGQRQTQKSSEPAAMIPAAATTSTGSKPGVFVYQCKTCNRCFPSFQALGGHRASHKKPKLIHNEEKKPLATKFMEVDEDKNKFNNMSTTLSLQMTNNRADALCNISSKPKVHECSICGAEFSSGQALGGHMRRHRSFSSTTASAAAAPTTTLSVGTASSPESQESKKPRNVLQLDLNLPAPEDDHHREPKFSFTSKGKLLVFSASSLVDCHY